MTDSADNARGLDWEGFGRDLLESWPVRDVDGSELFDAALRNGLIAEIPGGYDPDQHIDAEGICPEAGDPWYEYAFHPARADLEAIASPSIVTQPDPMADPRVTALVDALRWSRLQIEYLDCESPRGTSQVVLAQIDTVLAAFETTDTGDKDD